ncbi:hypothetical protein BGZ63DRAFT_350184 [Mariannaea sp. PMI_226]|nr:hypothetical protein BGZ63DRAFT_350184 [Mariannaea sp. PMI_226]
MASCNHTRWIRLRKNKSEVIVEASDRPMRLLNDLAHPEEPVGFVLLLGNRHKAAALRRLGVDLPPTKCRRSHGEIHLTVCSLSNDAQRPVIVADGDLPSHNRLPIIRDPRQCHETIEQRASMLQPGDRVAPIADDVYHRLLFPFLDVVCLFVSDIGGVDCAVPRLRAWFEKGLASTCPIQPRLMLVVSQGQEEEMQAAVDQMIRDTEPTRCFQRIQVVCLSDTSTEAPCRAPPTTTSIQALQKELVASLSLVQNARQQRGYLLSARHSSRLLCSSVSSPAMASSMGPQPIDLIKASRGSQQVAPELASHLAHVLSLDDTLNDKTGDGRLSGMLASMIPLISSSLLLDQYPPGAHPFHPLDVFRTLFRDPCIEAFERWSSERTRSITSSSAFTDLVEKELVSQFDEYLSLGSSSVTLHRLNLARAGVRWQKIQSDGTCLVCSCRRPQYALLGCIHSICQSCVTVFYPCAGEDPNVYHVDACILCDTKTEGQIVRIKPPTARARVLSIDGGGARALVPLENLRALQNAVGLPYPVQRNFDVAVGTSSGAMAVCALFVNGWSVDDCLQYLHVAVFLAFQRHFFLRLVLFIFGGLPFVSNMLDFLVSLVADGKYSSKQLEMMQRDVYGPKRSIMDSHEASRMGAMVAVTLTTTHDTSTFIATNYNGIGNRDPGCGYFYQSYRIDGVGTFQDGGLTFNNPTPIAIKEASALFPTAGKPSIVVSLGTGFGRPRYNPNAWYPARLIQAVCKQPEQPQALDEGGEVFRFDLEFHGQQPSLDDVSHISETAALARKATMGSALIQRLARRIRAELFLFELDPAQPPRYANGSYDCVGHISCRLRAGTPEFLLFMEQLHQSGAFFRCDGQDVLSSFRQCDMVQWEGNFRQEITFHLANREDRFEVLLCEESGISDSACNIGGSPFTVDRLTEQQGLEPWFGASGADRKRPRLDVASELGAKRRKLSNRSTK